MVLPPGFQVKLPEIKREPVNNNKTFSLNLRPDLKEHLSTAQSFADSAFGELFGDEKRRSDYGGTHNYPSNRKSSRK